MNVEEYEYYDEEDSDVDQQPQQPKNEDKGAVLKAERSNKKMVADDKKESLKKKTLNDIPLNDAAAVQR